MRINLSYSKNLKTIKLRDNKSSYGRILIINYALCLN